MPRRLLAALAAILLVASQAGSALGAAWTASGGGGPAASAPIGKGLIEDLDSGKADRFVVEYTAKADLRGASKVVGHAQRGQFVLDTLTANARRSQAAGLALANRAGAKATSYWLYNEIIVQGDAKLAQQFAKLPGVSVVRAMKVYPLVKPVPSKVGILQAGDPEWGVEKIGAPGAWEEGILGQGVVVANVDGGVDYSHPALVNQYRGNNGDGTFTHDYNWWDPTGICGDEPCDNVGHGTHTMGTMVGGDGPGPFTPDIGVAPGARWIAAKGCEDLFCSEDALLSSGQFILAPTDLNGENADPSKRPDIVNNSWGSGPGDPFYLATVQAWRAAGIIPVFSAGNAGEFGCDTTGSPGDFLESFSVGATDVDDNIAPFSSRGPSVFGKIDPDVSAPGVAVTSSVPEGGYASFNGTSMAAPHVSGTIALILSGRPALLGDPTAYAVTTDAVKVTAVDRIDDSCGGAEDGDPNNVYGEGRINAKAAVDLVAFGGTLAGTVTDVDTDDPIPGAAITANNGDREFSAVTDADGNYELFLAADTYLVTAAAFGYSPQLASGVTIETDQTTDQDFELDALPRFTVSGHVLASEDGSPIEGASVRALGTPVPAAMTDGAGAYDLELPIGDYILRASAGGCTEVLEAEISLVDDDITQDFALFRKLDNFGHGCRGISFSWVDAQNQTGVYGDEFAGRLQLPFDFEFYGETYSQVFINDNGYVNFLSPEQGFFIPSAIPSASPPNAAIYPLWSDLIVDADAVIDYDTIGSSPNRAFVLEFSQMRVLGLGTARVSFELKLWEDGRIDMLYGANPASPGDGRSATIGIENAAGDDALQFSFLEGLLEPNSAFRYEHVPSGFVSGVVTDANDGEPVSGAQITATPGGRSTTTADDGSYSFRLRPGSYELEASATNYVTAIDHVTVVDEGESTVDFVLDAAVGSVDPTEVSATVDFGDTADVDVTLSSSGTAPLTWEAKERDQGVTLPDLPPVSVTAVRQPTWGRQPLPAGIPTIIIHDTVPGPGGSANLSPIITDPAGDSFDSNDIVGVRGGSDGTSVASVAIDFSPATPMDEVGGYFYLDTDQDPSTGLPAEELFGQPGQDIGMEYFVELFFANSDGVVLIVSAETFEVVAEVGASVEDKSILFDIPLEVLGGDDGFINVAMVAGLFAPSDWAPDEGHGTIEPFLDAPWIAVNPESGEIDPGESQVVTIHLGTDTLSPGEYHAQVVFVTNAPKQTMIPVDVAFTVNLPDEFGAINGTVIDAHTEEPLGGVSVAVHATWNGNPLELTAITGDDGTYAIVGPAGTWSADFSLDGYVTDTHDVTIVEGVTTSGVDAALHKDQAHAQLDGSPVTFFLTPDRTASKSLTLSNPGGHEDLTFSIGEVNLDLGSEAVEGVTGSRHLPAATNPNKRTTFGLTGRAPLNAPPAIQADGDVLASWNAGLSLPWGVGYTGDVWLSDPIDLINAQFTTAGSRIADFPNPTDGEWGADMAYDAGRGLIWQVNVGGDNGLYGFHPSDGSVEQVITGSPWSDTSQRGVAYDPAADVFYVGGWNEGIVYRVAGPSHPTPGETLSQCNPADPNISGLAWNGSFGMLWEATNSETDTIFLLDPASCDTVRAIDHPDGGDFGGAGIETDIVGNLWLTGQNSGNAYLVESGLPNFSDVPWLTVEPTEGTVSPDESVSLTVTADSTGLTPGVYRAIVVVQTNDPDNSNIQVPVVLVVPVYQQGINAGGNAYIDPATGDLYATDRAFSAGGFGYTGGSARSTGAAIDGTDRDPLYQDLRQGMSAYQFAVPNGVYRVDLSFAEIQLQKAGARVFNVSLEGAAVLSNLDVFAAAGGRRVAYDQSFVVEVTDGVLDVSFAAQRGDQPIVNAILVTELPPGSPQ